MDECVMTEMFACNTSIGGEICINLPGTFKCECNVNLGFVLIDGICQSKQFGVLMRSISPISCHRTDDVVIMLNDQHYTSVLFGNSISV